MKFELADAVFSTPDTPRLLSMFLAGLDGRHRVLLADATTTHYDQWLASLDGWSQLVCTDVINQATRVEATEPAFHTVTVVRANTSSWGFSPPLLTLADASDLMTRPYRLLLEGPRTDLWFLLAMATFEERRFITERHDLEWLEVEGCGGITAVAARVEELRSARARIRCSTLVDSDAESPGQTSRQAQDVIDACGLLIHHHCLARRAIENYLPVSVLERWATRRPSERERARRQALVDAFERLSPEQQRHYHIKRGFHAPHADGRGELFDGIPQNDQDTLFDGFPEQMARLFERSVREAELTANGGWQEMRPFIQGLVARLR